MRPQVLSSRATIESLPGHKSCASRVDYFSGNSDIFIYFLTH